MEWVSFFSSSTSSLCPPPSGAIQYHTYCIEKYIHIYAPNVDGPDQPGQPAALSELCHERSGTYWISEVNEPTQMCREPKLMCVIQVTHTVTVLFLLFFYSLRGCLSPIATCLCVMIVFGLSFSSPACMFFWQHASVFPGFSFCYFLSFFSNLLVWCIKTSQSILNKFVPQVTDRFSSVINMINMFGWINMCVPEVPSHTHDTVSTNSLWSKLQSEELWDQSALVGQD